MSSENNLNLINKIIKSKSGEALNKFANQVYELEYINKIILLAETELQELKFNFEEEIKNFDRSKLNKKYTDFDELSPHLFLKPGTFRKEIVQSFEIKFDDKEIKNLVYEKSFSFTKIAFKKARDTIVYSDAYEALRKTLNEKNYNCKISTEINNPMYGSYLMSIDIFHKEDPFYSSKKQEPSKEEIEREKRVEDLKKEHLESDAKQALSESPERRLLKFINAILCIFLFIIITQFGINDLFFNLRFWEQPLALYIYAAIPTTIFFFINFDDEFNFKSLKNYKKYLKIHNWTVAIAMVVTVFTFMYHLTF